MKRYIVDSKIIIKYAFLLAFSALFLLIFSLWTSPFYKNWYGCDASFFTMAGRGILNGFVPYRDFFDLKGPCFFFIEALSQVIIKGRSGAFCLQIFALFFALTLIIKTSRIFLSRKKALVITCIFLFFHIATLWGGNTLEEYMLPLNLLPIYLVLRDVSSNNNNESVSISYLSEFQIKSITALITGLCFGVILFSKITVGAPIAGLVISICIIFLKNKRIKDLIEFLLFSLLGVLIVTTLVFIYFAAYGMLREMLYSVFVFAFKRSIDFGETFNLKWELKISGCYFALIFVICQVITVPSFIKTRTISSAELTADENKIDTTGTQSTRIDIYEFLLLLTALCALLTAVCLHFGTPFIYYFTTVYPVLMLAFISMFIKYRDFSLFKTWRLDIPILAFLITLCYFASFSADTISTVIYDRDNKYYQNYYDDAIEMASLIPECDRDNVYSINMDMQWFEINQMLPCYSYTINLQFFVDLDPRIQESIINRIKTNPPKWIVIGGDLASYLPKLNDEVFPRYDVIYINNYGALYLLK